MKNKKDLTQIALAALILASAAPVNGQVNMIQADGIFLAAGCPAHGCPAATNGGGNRPPSTGYNSNGDDSFNSEYYKGTADDDRTGSVSKPSEPLTETQLLGMLGSQGKVIYLSLNAEGKALALELASKDSYRDKNLAVKEAQRRMNERPQPLNR